VKGVAVFTFTNFVSVFIIILKLIRKEIRRWKQIDTYTTIIGSGDSSVGIALGYGLDDQSSGVRFPAGAGNFSLNHRVQNVYGTHPASYPMDNRGSFPGGKAAGA
jgi:hypothetical protein